MSGGVAVVVDRDGDVLVSADTAWRVESLQLVHALSQGTVGVCASREVLIGHDGTEVWLSVAVIQRLSLVASSKGSVWALLHRPLTVS